MTARPLLALAVAVTLHAAVAAAAPRCPDGEMTLTAPQLRAKRHGAGADHVGSPVADFVLPAGVSIDPLGEPVSVILEGDHRPLFRADLPPGAFVARAGGRAVVADAPSARGALGAGSRIVLWHRGPAYRLSLRLSRVDVPGLADAPHFAKLLLAVGDDCFSAVLVCTAHGRGLACAPERTARLAGGVAAADGAPLPGTMLTVFDDARLESVSVFAQTDGHYRFPALRPGPYRLRARRLGLADVETPITLVAGKGVTRDIRLTPVANANEQLPASQFFGQLLDEWPTPTIRADFTLSCGNCHQIAGPRFREDKSVDEWGEVVAQMQGFLPPYHAETRPLILPNLLAVFGPDVVLPPLPVPPPPSGDVLRAVVYEYGLGDAGSRPSCHDMQLGTDGRLYNDSGLLWIDPRTGERGVYPMDGGGHSIQRDRDGNLWITQPDTDRLAKLDLATGAFAYYPLPKIGDDQGAYPHTLRFAADGSIWLTLSKSNHVARFDPHTGSFTYYRLPPSDPAETGLSIPVPYGCDVAPDGAIWWSQLFGDRIGRVDPDSGAVTAWKPPFDGPRRLRVGADGIVWVPGYGEGVLGRFDPAIERWQVFDLPTGPPGPLHFGNAEQPYALNADRRSGDVWITGSASDTLVRFRPRTAQFDAFPVPTRGSFMREIVFDPDDNVWTCTSNEPDVKEGLGRGKFVKIELPPRDAVCGNGIVEGDEECDDGNAVDCDACSSACTIVDGCGDGVVCGAEACDDGNRIACDGCSPTCTVEVGLRCGDGIVNTACGEDCDPPDGTTCDAGCRRVGVCGDGVVDPGEECDDGNAVDCDVCSNHCTLVTGCGDGTVCGDEACDDGNTTGCDGCSPTCTLEPGARCGDGVVDAACGEECDPPSAATGCNQQCRLGAQPLGVRHLTFGGSSYSSALGTSVPIAALVGTLDLVAGVAGADGVAPVTVAGPTYYAGPILGGSFGTLCTRVTGCTGSIDCDGGTAVDVEVVQDSAGPGRQGLPPQASAGVGADGGPGAVLLACQGSVVQLPPGPVDCAAATYPPDGVMYYTTGQSSGRFDHGDPRVGTGELVVRGENFSCAGWTTTDGPGRLAATFLVEDDPQAGDTANANVLDD